MSAPFDIRLIIARLAAEVPTLQQVRGAADYASLSALRDLRPPEAFALVLAEHPSVEQKRPNSTGAPLPAGHARQAVTTEFAVVTGVRNVRYQNGQPAIEDALPLIGEIRDALIGWIPLGVPLARGCAWLHGYVLDYDAGTLLWSDVFTTQHAIGRTA